MRRVIATVWTACALATACDAGSRIVAGSYGDATYRAPPRVKLARIELQPRDLVVWKWSGGDLEVKGYASVDPSSPPLDLGDRVLFASRDSSIVTEDPVWTGWPSVFGQKAGSTWIVASVVEDSRVLRDSVLVEVVTNAPDGSVTIRERSYGWGPSFAAVAVGDTVRFVVTTPGLFQGQPAPMLYLSESEGTFADSLDLSSGAASYVFPRPMFLNFAAGAQEALGFLEVRER